VEGSVEVASVELVRGHAAFVPARTARWAAHGDGTVYRATVNL
jgi:hypothetical protein